MNGTTVLTAVLFSLLGAQYLFIFKKLKIVIYYILGKKNKKNVTSCFIIEQFMATMPINVITFFFIVDIDDYQKYTVQLILLSII